MIRLLLALLLLCSPALAEEPCRWHWCSNDTAGVLGDEVLGWDMPAEWVEGCPVDECFVEVWSVGGDVAWLCGRVDWPATTFELSGSACHARPSPILLDQLPCQVLNGEKRCGGDLTEGAVEFLLFACVDSLPQICPDPEDPETCYHPGCERVCPGATHRNLQDAYEECTDGSG
jgi:hypothetical protein